MISQARVQELLEPFSLKLNAGQIDLLLAYLNLLLRWNEKINLTAIRDPEECVTRHFGESLYISQLGVLAGPLLDVGSGAGFPGLAIKLIYPAISVTLLEPVAKKRAFLKEITRACGFKEVEVRADRLQEFVKQAAVSSFGTLTARAVGGIAAIAGGANRLLRSGGRLCLWIGTDQLATLAGEKPAFKWLDPAPLPDSRQRVIAIGLKH